MLGESIDAWDVALNAWFATLGTPVEATARLTLSVIFGGLVGLEREMRGRQAGFRTYILVCLGSALVMLVSVNFATHPWAHPANVNLNVDPARIAYGVMTGIGFLGAGTIVHAKGTVRGLTTAAGLWCVAAVGLSIGFGLYLISALATGLILVVLWVLDYIEEILPKVRYRTVAVRTKYKPGCIGDAVDLFKKLGIDVVDVDYRRSDDLTYAEMDLKVAFFSNQQYFQVERQIEEDPNYQLLATREL